MMQSTSLRQVGNITFMEDFSISRGIENGWTKNADVFNLTPFVLTTQEWTTALEHSEMVIVLLADTKGIPLYPLSNIIQDHFVLHKLQSTPFEPGNILNVYQVGFICKEYWKYKQGYTSPYGYTLPVSFLHAPTDEVLRNTFVTLNLNMIKSDCPHDNNDAITIFTNKADIDRVTKAAKDTLDVSMVWLIHD